MKHVFLALCLLAAGFFAYRHFVPVKIGGTEETLSVQRLAADGKLMREEFQPRAAPYLALYHGASWCPPCQAFSPQLVDFYQHADKTKGRFQLVMVNYDQSDADMAGYMRQHRMPFPALRREAAGGWGKATGNGIPNLIILETATGKVVSSSFDGTSYQGCEVPLQVLARIVAQGHP